MADAALPVAYTDVAAVRALLQRDPSTAFGQGGDDGCGVGVVALRGDAVVGYLLARLADADAHPATFDGWALRGRAAVVSLAACAVSPDDPERRELLRRLYAAAATRWLEAGALAHYVRLPDADALALEAFWSLGFGQDITSSIRDVASLPGVDASGSDGATIRPATASDAPHLGGFVTTMLRHHVLAPAFFPCSTASAAWGQTDGATYLDDPTHVGFVAQATSGEIVGMVLLEPPTWAPHPLTCADGTCYLSDLTVALEWRGSGLAQALFQRAVLWATDAGYRSMTLSYMASNLAASAFWTRLGFRRMDVRLVRHLDPRLLTDAQRQHWAGYGAERGL